MKSGPAFKTPSPKCRAASEPRNLVNAEVQVPYKFAAALYFPMSAG